MSQKFKIEMVVPNDVDPSDLLARCQELALSLHEEFPECDDEGDEIELDDDAKAEIENAVSVQSVDDDDEAAILATLATPVS